MAIRWVEKTAPMYGTNIDATITYPSPRETSGLTTTLPTADPGTAGAQLSVTLAGTDFPTVPLYGNQWGVIGHVKGQNTSGSTATLNWYAGRVIGGTDTITATGSLSVPTTQYWNLMYYQWPPAAYVAGDKLYIRLWNNLASGMILQFTHFAVLPTRIMTAPPGYVLAGVTLDYTPKPTFTAANSNWNSAGLVLPGIDLTTYWLNNSTIVAGNRQFSFLPNKDASVGALQLYYPDLGTTFSAVAQAGSSVLTTITSCPTRVRGRLMPI